MIIGKIISIFGTKVEIVLQNNDIKIGNILCLVDDETKKFEVVKLTKVSAICIAFSNNIGLKKGSEIRLYSKEMEVEYSDKIFGRMFDAYGNAIDGKEFSSSKTAPVVSNTVPLNELSTDDTPLWTGIKAIDFFTPIKKGFKVGIVGNTGSGKTVLLKQIIDNMLLKTNSHLTFVGIGGRISEASKLYQSMEEKNLLERISIVFSSMMDPELARYKSLLTGITIEEYIRDIKKEDSLLFIDNIYRFIQAKSQISEYLEQPLIDGYPSNLNHEISQIEERINGNENGAITSFQGIDKPYCNSDPAINSILSQMDVEIVLDNKLASFGYYPAIDIFTSTSKLVDIDKIGKRHYNLIKQVLKCFFRYKELEEVVDALGLDELSVDDKNTFNKARELQSYFTQPMSKDLKDSPHSFVKIDDILDDVEKIINASYGDKS